MYFNLFVLILLSDHVFRLSRQKTETKLYRLNAADKLVAEVDVMKMDVPKCYSDGYMAWKEEIKLMGTLRFKESALHTMDVYWQHESGRTNLICRFDVKKKGCTDSTDSPCIWWEVSYHMSYEFNISQIATPEINNSMFLMVPMMKDATWQAVSDLIKVHPSPLPIVKMNDRELDPDNCFVDAPVGTTASLEFCVEHLNDPKVSVSVMRNPEEYQEKKCVKRDISITWDELEVHMTYMGGCRQFGSVTCYFNGLNQTSSKVEANYSHWLAILGIVTTVCIGLGLIFYGYTIFARSLMAGKDKKGSKHRKESHKSKGPVKSASANHTGVTKSKSKEHEHDEDSSSSSDDEDAGLCGNIKNLLCSLQ